MLDHNETMTMTKALDRAIESSKIWSEVAHKTFAEMAAKARDDVTKKGDFSFIRQFRMQFAIPEQTQTLNDRTLETQFNLMMQPVYTHFAKFANDYERANKRRVYMELLKADKPKFVEMMQTEQGIHNAKLKLSRGWGQGNPECEILQEVWRTFHEEEKARQQREKEEEQRQKMDAIRKRQGQNKIEEEARRRIEQEAFELAVQAKMRELKQ